MKYLLSLLVLTPILATAQKKLKSYRATNGITYEVGDTVRMGRGSAPNGDFLYLQLGGWGAIATMSQNQSRDQNNIGRLMSGGNVVIKKIHATRWKGATKISFAVGGGNISNYVLYIEDAIAAGEVVPNTLSAGDKGNDVDVASQLAQLKDLFDSGALTEDEYTKAKSKILNQ